MTSDLFGSLVPLAEIVRNFPPERLVRSEVAGCVVLPL